MPPVQGRRTPPASRPGRRSAHPAARARTRRTRRPAPPPAARSNPAASSYGGLRMAGGARLEQDGSLGGRQRPPGASEDAGGLGGEVASAGQDRGGGAIGDRRPVGQQHVPLRE